MPELNHHFDFEIVCPYFNSLIPAYANDFEIATIVFVLFYFNHINSFLMCLGLNVE